MAHALDAETLAGVARSMLDMPHFARPKEDKEFQSFFGAPINVILILWNLIVAKSPLSPRAHPKHLLWGIDLSCCFIYRKQQEDSVLNSKRSLNFIYW